MKKKKILLVGGARPNFMKVSPVYEALKKHRRFQPILVHTGQHYDAEMSKVFFDDLKLPKPDIHLGVGSGTHAVQTGKIMERFEKVCIKDVPDLVIVVGDVNSTVACALVAGKLRVPVAHVEAGLRSFDRTMPEEINRLLTDQISDYLFTTCSDADKNLLREGISRKKIFFVGNTMIDSLKRHLTSARATRSWQKLGLDNTNYGIMTLHRPSNVDDIAVLQRVMDAVSQVSQNLPIVFPVHPRTAKQYGNIQKRVYDSVQKKGILMVEPLGYLEFLGLMQNASLVLTDSGGIQEESTILGIPCLTLRNNTERPITIKQGTNILVGNDPEQIIKGAMRQLKKGKRRKRIPKYWDGKAAVRIARILHTAFERKR
jgi:UDP-N-acetylglucosamine 2-epimerase (non-hydrolysing)